MEPKAAVAALLESIVLLAVTAAVLVTYFAWLTEAMRGFEDDFVADDD